MHRQPPRLDLLVVTPRDGGPPLHPRTPGAVEELLAHRPASRVTARLVWSDDLRWELEADAELELVPGFQVRDFLAGAVRLLGAEAAPPRAALARLAARG